MLSFNTAANQRVKGVVDFIGSNLQPMDCYMTMRGLKTLALRLDAMSGNAKALAEALSGSALGGVVLFAKQGERVFNMSSNNTWVEAVGVDSLVFLGIEDEKDAVAVTKAAFGL